MKHSILPWRATPDGSSRLVSFTNNSGSEIDPRHPPHLKNVTGNLHVLRPMLKRN